MAEITKSRDDGASARPSFPRRRESGPLDSGNIQRLSESLVMVGWASAHRFRRHQMPCRASDGIRGLVG
ncbi:hypothetical protein NEILACOT_04241 [Neisseria lactamica ATCC 23970]|uniref:Uncharacterized protein n=1 Tax=Neisseria lactamica ATCC 23970 TaxID=546265 RepID=D0W9M9_NEILA|nr:hypothetical protein NEILACOT_04241 [Neisseria lactamica ATCC 23970]